MSECHLLDDAGRKGADPKALAVRATGEPGALVLLLEGLDSREPRVKYGCAKVLHAVSQTNPAVLYPAFDRFAALLSGRNKILRWEAIRILGNLAGADTENRFEGLLEAYLAPIPGPELITAANTIQGAAAVAKAKPHLAGRIAREFLKVEGAAYKTPECRNVALGQVIDAFDEILVAVESRETVIDFVKRQLDNPRVSTRKKARAFLARHPEVRP
ncbi:MAG: hypothetical protein KA419_12350 [Acidobacteria bacterium]|nr:hypothetical protein [Acidobacteriota bacterium]